MRHRDGSAGDAADLGSGAWDAGYGALRQQPTYLGSLYLLVSAGKA